MGGPRKCRTCQEKLAQFKGLCHSCAIAAGITPARQLEREREHVERVKSRLEKMTKSPLPRAPLYRTISGVEYEVTFDGSQPPYSQPIPAPAPSPSWEYFEGDDA